ncbi:MAG: ABC transporter substrate-binding protein [Actinomadura sp.]
MARLLSRTSAARRLAILATALATVLAGCGKPSSSGSGSDSGEPVTIGISLPLTGDFSQPGTQAKRGYEVWANMVNAKGGLLGRKVELKITDDASNQDTVVSDYTRLITQD